MLSVKLIIFISVYLATMSRSNVQLKLSILCGPIQSGGHDCLDITKLLTLEIYAEGVAAKIWSGLTVATSRRHVHFYRKDYTFFEEFDAFYKIHWDLNGLSWNSAFMACEDEGGKLFYPKDDGEWTVTKNLTAEMSVPPNITDIFIGIHDEFGLGEFITVDGHSTESPLGEDSITADGQHCISMDIETGTYKSDSCFTEPDTIRPFVCKKVEEDPCPTIDRGYSYVKETKKCYKVNDRLKTWQEAMHTCFMEGGLLVVVESQAESNIISSKITDNQEYFTGFRKIFSDRQFYTIKGQKFEEGGFQRWNYDDQEDSGNCGVIFSSNQLYTRARRCDKPLPFVCEMEPRV